MAAIPIWHIHGKEGMVGSGFLARSMGKLGFYTAAHLLTKKSLSTTDWTSWAPILTAKIGPGRETAMELFSGPRAEPTPMFAFINTGEIVADMICLRSPAVLALAKHYEVLQFAEDTTTPGLPIVCEGYPHRQETWPSSEPSRIAGTAKRIAHDGHILLSTDMIAEEGFSGGPVTDQAGNLRGMLIGSDHDGTRIVPQTVLRYL